ncbi:MAG: DNA primase, partial [Pseudomonadota bacterium]
YYNINETAAKFYNHLLVNDRRAEDARKYLEKRGINLETIHEYLLGFAPQSWDTLVSYLKTKHLSLPSANKIGLIISKDNGKYYDRFRNRIIFPIFNVSRNAIGFGGRVISEGEPKYLNSPESPIYNKRNNLYGLVAASHAIQKEQKAIIVEGYLDLLTLHQAGIKNSVAALGTALTEQHIQILKRYTANIITIFDADPSGEKAMIRSLEPFLKSGVSPKLVLLPPGDDPDSFVRQHGGKAFSEKIEGAGLLLDFVIESIIKKHNLGTPRGKVNSCDEIIPLLELISDRLERDLYVQKISQRIGVSETHIRSRHTTAQKKENTAGPERQKLESPLAFEKNAELLILTLMVAHPETIATIESESLLDEFLEPDLKALGSLLADTYKEQGGLSLALVMDNLHEERLKSILAKIFFQNTAQGDPFKILEDCIRNIRLKKISSERKKINLLLKQAEAVHDESSSVKYQQRYLQLVEQQKKIVRFKLNFLQ